MVFSGFFLVMSMLIFLLGLSQSLGEQLNVKFNNQFQTPISIYWAGPTSNSYMFDMGSKESMGINTFAGHKFFSTLVGQVEAPLEYVSIGLSQSYTFGLLNTTTEQQCDATTGTYNVAPSAPIPKGANDKGTPIYKEVKKGECFDRYNHCNDYYVNGECERNPGWTTINCPISCKTCHLLDPKVRCDRKRMNVSDVPIYAPGDLNAMFSGIKEKFDDRYGVTIHSEKPWVVTFDNFLTDDEVDALIDTVEGTWERSTDTGTANEFGEVGRVLSTGRTSSNAWCRHKCESNPSVQRVQQKIAEITGIPSGHSESFQILKYDLGQKYNAHLDFSGSFTGDQACGPRILTFFLYLSDVEEGGETAFPLLDLAVKPQKGKAVLWPSVHDDDLEMPEQLSLHEARPVIKGVKYAANSWIHLYDFATPNLHGCTGTFDVL